MSMKTNVLGRVKVQGDINEKTWNTVINSDWSVVGRWLARNPTATDAMSNLVFEGESIAIILFLLHQALTQQKAMVKKQGNVKKQRNAKKPIGRGRGR